MTYNFGTRQEENTSFQKQERVFHVFGNSYFGSPIRNGLRTPSLFNFITSNIENTISVNQGKYSLTSCDAKIKLEVFQKVKNGNFIIYPQFPSIF